MTRPFSTLAITGTLLLSPLAPAADVNTTPAKGLDLERYLGIWHETARLDNIFERGLHAATALYERLADGRIRVTNSGTAADGQRYDAIGIAQQQEGAEASALEVSFVPPYTGFFSDYRILYVTPDYSGALVSDAEGDNLWILERGEGGDPAVRQRLLEEAEQRGFDTSELIYESELYPDGKDAEASEAAVDTE